MTADDEPLAAADHSDHSEDPISSMVTALPTYGVGLKEMQIRVDHDNQFFELHGAATRAESAALFNSVDGVYQAEIELSIKIIEQHVWTHAGHPYEDNLSEDPVDWGQILSDFRSNNQLSDFKDSDTSVAIAHKHLFSGRTPPGNVIGAAYLRGLCNPSNNLGVTTNFGSNATRIVTLAHEIAHNLGARHTVESPTNCFDADDIMCWYVQAGARSFLSIADSQIAAYLIPNGTCLSDPTAPLAQYAIFGKVLVNGVERAFVEVTLQGIGTSTTGEFGDFSFSNIIPGNYVLSAVRDGLTFDGTPIFRTA